MAAQWIIRLAISKSSEQFPKISHLGDNTSAQSWLRKNSFNTKTHPEHNTAVRSFAKFLMISQASLTSCHIPGASNYVADCLSRDTHLNRDQLEFILPQLFPRQVPDSLTLVDLSAEIISDLASLKHCCPNRKGSPQKLVRSTVGTVLDGASTLKVLDSTIRGWTDLINIRETGSSMDLPTVCDIIYSAAGDRHSYAPAQSTPSLGTFVRPFGRTFGTTLEWTDFKAMRQQTPPNVIKRRYLFESSRHYGDADHLSLIWQ